MTTSEPTTEPGRCRYCRAPFTGRDVEGRWVDFRGAIVCLGDPVTDHNGGELHAPDHVAESAHKREASDAYAALVAGIDNQYERDLVRSYLIGALTWLAPQAVLDAIDQYRVSDAAVTAG